jgi:hypothetical protein
MVRARPRGAPGDGCLRRARAGAVNTGADRLVARSARVAVDHHGRCQRRRRAPLWGRLTAAIRNGAGDPDPANLSDVDFVTLTLASRAGGPTLSFPGGNRAALEAWAQENREAILGILFPGNLSSSVLGRRASDVYAQQLLFASVLGAAVRRPGALGRGGHGGLVDVEWFGREDRRPGDSGVAWQGLHDFTGSLSVQGRFAVQQEDVRTRAGTVAVDYHPFVELNRSVVWRVGGLARSGVTYSTSRALDLASLDFAGGGWASAFKDFGGTRVGGGALLQGARSHVPGFVIDDTLAYVATTLNDRGIDLSVSYGASIGHDTSDRTVVLGKIVRTQSVTSDTAGAGSTLVIVCAIAAVGVSPAVAQDRFRTRVLLGAPVELDVDLEYHDPGELDRRLGGSAVLPIWVSATNVSGRLLSLDYADLRLDLGAGGAGSAASIAPMDAAAARERLIRDGRYDPLVLLLAAPRRRRPRTWAVEARLRLLPAPGGRRVHGFHGARHGRARRRAPVDRRHRGAGADRHARRPRRRGAVDDQRARARALRPALRPELRRALRGRPVPVEARSRDGHA